MSASRSRSAGAVTMAALALVAVSCGSGDNAGTARPAPPTTSTVPATVPVQSAKPVAPETRTETETVTVPAPAPAQTSQIVPCVDPNSENVRNALAGLGPDQWGGVYAIDENTAGTSADGCPTLEWARATATGTSHVTVTSHILFFTNRGDYLGTATSDAYSYTSVVDATDSTVTVRYRWLSETDAFCCPSNESLVTFTLDGDTIVPSGEFPPPQ